MTQSYDDSNWKQEYIEMQSQGLFNNVSGITETVSGQVLEKLNPTSEVGTAQYYWYNLCYDRWKKEKGYE